MTILITLFIIVIAFWLFTTLYLIGPSLTRYDKAEEGDQSPIEQPTDGPSQAHFDAIDVLRKRYSEPKQGSAKEQLAQARAGENEMGKHVSLEGLELIPTKIGGINAEWLIADNTDPKQRLLYIHGGGLRLGSPLSHRSITTELARSTGLAVLAIDYRLMPENTRRDCSIDCQTSYRWILEHGPKEDSPATALVVAGDSAGGNLTLEMAAWARDNQVKPANAIVAMGPVTDGTMSGPSIKNNLATDHFLKPMLAPVTKLPRVILAWLLLLANRMRPSNPNVSPIHGDLSGLPPILIQVSSAECFFDDSKRYAIKAQRSGTSVTVQVWEHMLHIWHLHNETMPEAQDAMKKIKQFIDQHVAD